MFKLFKDAERGVAEAEAEGVRRRPVGEAGADVGERGGFAAGSWCSGTSFWKME